MPMLARLPICPRSMGLPFKAPVADWCLVSQGPCFNTILDLVTPIHLGSLGA